MSNWLCSSISYKSGQQRKWKHWKIPGSLSGAEEALEPECRTELMAVLGTPPRKL